jgi:hypothetical protein
MASACEESPSSPAPASAGDGSRDTGPDKAESAAASPRPLSEVARRALAEAEARRAELDRRAAELTAVKEKDGRDGPEPVRYGDWEVKGLASDF